MIIGLKQRTIIFVREKIYSGTSVSHMVSSGIKPGKSTVSLRSEFTQSNRVDKQKNRAPPPHGARPFLFQPSRPCNRALLAARWLTTPMWRCMMWWRYSAILVVVEQQNASSFRLPTASGSGGSIFCSACCWRTGWCCGGMDDQPGHDIPRLRSTKNAPTRRGDWNWRY